MTSGWIQHVNKKDLQYLRCMVNVRDNREHSRDGIRLRAPLSTWRYGAACHIPSTTPFAATLSRPLSAPCQVLNVKLTIHEILLGIIGATFIVYGQFLPREHMEAVSFHFTSNFIQIIGLVCMVLPEILLVLKYVYGRRKR